MPPDQPSTPAWLQRLFRFGVTGILSTIIHIAVAAELISRLSMAPYIANPIAFIVATCFAYAANTLWSFASRMSHRTLWRYLCVAAISCLATAAVSAAAESAGLDYRIGIALVIVIVTPMNFVMHSLWTYRRAR